MTQLADRPTDQTPAADEAPATTRDRAKAIAVAVWDRTYLGLRRLSRFRGKRLVRLLLVLTLLGLGSSWFAAEQYRQPVRSGVELTFDEALDLGRKGDIYDATFYDYDSRIVVHRSGGPSWISYPKSDAETSRLVDAMRAGKTPIRFEKQSLKASIGFYEQFLLPILVLANLFGLLFLAGRGEGGAREYSEFSKVRGGHGIESSAGASGRRKGVPPVTFANVAGAQTAVVELAEIVDYLRDPSKFERVGALPPKGVLLFGPPGCGKTLLARAVAGEAGVPFYSLSGSEFVESLVGVGAARVRDLFETVRRNAPAIVFIDELDAAGRKRGAGVGGGNDEREQTLNQMLVEMDGFQTQSGVVVIGATNRPDILDPALLRPGRFDRHITVERPDAAGRFDILRLYAADRPIAVDVDLEVLARRTPGFTGAELANVWNEAALLTVRAGLDAIGMAQLDEAVQRVLSGPKRSGESLTLEEQQLVAVHEAGHAVVAAALRDVHAVERVSVARRGLGLGHAALLRDDRVLLRKSEMVDRMAIAISGKSAEEVFFGEASTGAEADIEGATDLAREMAGRYGMTDGIGPVRVVGKDAEVFLGRDMAAMQMIAPATLTQLDLEIRSLIESAEERARELVLAHREVVADLANALVAGETVEGPALLPYLTRVVEAQRAAAAQPAPRKRTRAAAAE
ncbi:MAG TPA: ATP-dependent zinc metalloprotease FtsH [Mycobacteriales bacterium]|nr:ATP-dependent zinc metalloprotease FtsH [Mycobacteriales bacterium]